MSVLVTGCCGYIGSHTVVELLDNGIDVVGVDNFSNSKREVLDRINDITNKDIVFYEGTILDSELLDKVFSENKIDCVIDFAAFKSVGESVSKPIEYYVNNVSSVLTLIGIMQKHNVKNIVFSSSATVYGDAEAMPITEESEVGKTTNPYGTSKYMVEWILKDLYASDNEFGICILRYFNPIGAHKSGLIGEDPNGIPANLMPYISKVASGKLECLSIYGNDYDTKDGTGVRDYIHVNDLARGHLLAVNKLLKNEKGLFIYNLGTGTGYSVLDIVNAFERVNGIKINKKITERRPGDIAVCYSDPSKAYKELGFKCQYSLDDMVRDSWNFECKNNENEDKHDNKNIKKLVNL